MSNSIQGRRVAIYCRSAVRGSAVHNQAHMLKQYAADYGAKIVGTYKDNGRSGTSLSRPAYNKLRRKVWKGEVDTVLVQHPDRLARGFLPAMRLLRELEAYGVNLACLNGHGILSLTHSL